MEINKDAYNAYVKEVTPVNPVWKNIVRAFVTGGIICTIGQAVLNWLMSYGMDEKTAAAWNLLVLILGSIVLTGFNLYPKSAPAFPLCSPSAHRKTSDTTRRPPRSGSEPPRTKFPINVSEIPYCLTSILLSGSSADPFHN